VTSMQTKILGEIEKTVTDAGLELVRQPQYANTGDVFAQRGFDTVWQMHYSFDDGTCSLSFQGPGVRALNLIDSPPAYRYDEIPAWKGRLNFHALDYSEGDRIRLMLDLVRQFCGAKPDPEDDRGMALWFTPQAIRDHFDACDEDPTEGLTDEQLVEVGLECLTSDILYSAFHEVLMLSLEDRT
jgi:hypothetical protein